MVTLLRGADICAPERLGKQDILIEGRQITFIGDIPAEAIHGLPHAAVIDAEGLTATPGSSTPMSTSPVAEAKAATPIAPPRSWSAISCAPV